MLTRVSEKRVLLYLFCGVVAFELLWLVFAVLVAPGIVRRAYAGESLVFLNDMIAEGTPHPVEHYLTLWADTARRVALVVGAFGAIVSPILFLPSSGLGSNPEHSGRSKAPPARLWIGAVAAVLVLLGVAGLLHASPVRYLRLITEDGIAENLTFAGLAVAGVVFLRRALLVPGARRVGALLLAAGSILMALEEISWGQRLLGVSTPEFLRAYNRAGQTNLHNFLPMDSGKYLIVGLVILVGVVIWPKLIERSSPMAGFAERFGIPTVPGWVAPFFLVAAAFFLAVPVAVFPRGDELAELALALGLLSLAVGINGDGSIGSAFGHRPRLAITGTLAALCVTHVCLISAKAPQYVAFLENGAVRLLPELGYHQLALQVFEHLESGEGTWTAETLVRHGERLVALGMQEEAEVILARAVRLHRDQIAAAPLDARSYQSMAEALWLMGQKDAAWESVGVALALEEERLERERDENTKARIFLSRARTLAIVGAIRESAQEVGSACRFAQRAQTKIELAIWTEAHIPSFAVPEDCAFLADIARDDVRRTL